VYWTLMIVFYTQTWVEAKLEWHLVKSSLSVLPNKIFNWIPKSGFKYKKENQFLMKIMSSMILKLVPLLQINQFLMKIMASMIILLSMIIIITFAFKSILLQ